MSSALRQLEERVESPGAGGTGRAAPHATCLACQRCGFPVSDRAWGCKNPCANCGTVYPLGDCSD